MEFTDEEKQLLQDAAVDQFRALTNSPAYRDAIRNQFAAAALTGILAGAQADSYYFSEEDFEIVANGAFGFADTMLKARERN